jgi:hypothetical protein
LAKQCLTLNAPDLEKLGEQEGLKLTGCSAYFLRLPQLMERTLPCTARRCHKLNLPELAKLVELASSMTSGPPDGAALTTAECGAAVLIAILRGQ